ncbi:MAG: hypothetical protein WAV87_02265, partial [Trichococcus flocculiformis]
LFKIVIKIEQHRFIFRTHSDTPVFFSIFTILQEITKNYNKEMTLAFADRRHNLSTLLPVCIFRIFLHTDRTYKLGQAPIVGCLP